MDSPATSAGSATSEPVPSAEPANVERLLLEEGLLTLEQITKAKRIQARLEDAKPLAALVVDLGWVPRASLDAAIRKHRKKLPVEEILVEKGLLTREALVEARALAQSGESGPGRRLVEIGLVSERDYLDAYCERYDIPFVEADPSLIDPELLQRANVKYLLRHRVLPLALQDDSLSILTDDVPSREVLIDLERLFGRPVTFALGPRAKIEETLAAAVQGRVAVGAGSSGGGAIQYHRIEENVDADRITGIVDQLIFRAIRQGASDVHLEPMQSKLRVRFRVDGCLIHITDYPQAYTTQIISRIKVLAEADVAEHRVHQDGKIFVRVGEEDVDLRASFYVTVFGENAVLRILRKSKALIPLEEMGFPPGTIRAFVEDALDPATGIVLVTGPTGSGKTTTLYAAVDRINDVSKKIITAEDPVEYVIEGISQCSVVQRPGIDFPDSLKAIVRQDPDVILIGEIRDRQSAEMAIQSALTGHKVLSTFHTEDAVGALIRLIDMNIETFLIASTVTAVLAQRLVRKQCPHCRVDYSPSARELRALSVGRDDIGAFPLTVGKGCPSCLHTGYRGRVGVYELLVMTDPLRDAIVQKRPTYELRRLAAERPGFLSLQEDGIAKALRGETTLSEVLENTPRCQNVRPLGRLLEVYD